MAMARAMSTKAIRRFLPNLLSLPVSLSSCRQYMSAGARATATASEPELEYWEVPLEEAERMRTTPGSRWTCLGYPGAGKALYACRLAQLLLVPHISMGELLRREMERPTLLAKQLYFYGKQGRPISDEIIFSILYKRLEQGFEKGEQGFILEGFPCTVSQAEYLDSIVGVDLAVNLNLREEALVAKYMGRRVCTECGRDFNVANVDINEPGMRRIYLPPQLPPASCLNKMVSTMADSEEITRAKLQMYHLQSKPVEDYYHCRQKLVDFEILGGMAQTWPRLLEALKMDDHNPWKHLSPQVHVFKNSIPSMSTVRTF